MTTSLEYYRTTGRTAESCKRGKGILLNSSPGHHRVCVAPCKKWSCPACGKRKARKLGRKLAAAPVQRFFTLTQLRVSGESQKDAFTRIAKAWHALVKRIRREYKTHRFEYIKVYEVTKKGQPHIHVLANCDYIPQKWLSSAWQQISGAYIVDIRLINSGAAVRNYLSKYLSKGGNMPDGLHRYSISWVMARSLDNGTEELNSDDAHWSWRPASLKTYATMLEHCGWYVQWEEGAALTAIDMKLPDFEHLNKADQERWWDAVNEACALGLKYSQEHANDCDDQKCDYVVSTEVTTDDSDLDELTIEIHGNHVRGKV